MDNAIIHALNDQDAKLLMKNWMFCATLINYSNSAKPVRIFAIECCIARNSRPQLDNDCCSGADGHRSVHALTGNAANFRPPAS